MVERGTANVFASSHMGFTSADAKALVDAGSTGSLRRPRRARGQRTRRGREIARRFSFQRSVRDRSVFVYVDPESLDDAFFQAGLSPGVLTTLRSPAFKEKFRMDPYLAERQRLSDREEELESP